MTKKAPGAHSFGCHKCDWILSGTRQGKGGKPLPDWYSARIGCQLGWVSSLPGGGHLACPLGLFLPLLRPRTASAMAWCCWLPLWLLASRCWAVASRTARLQCPWALLQAGLLAILHHAPSRGLALPRSCSEFRFQCLRNCLSPCDSRRNSCLRRRRPFLVTISSLASLWPAKNSCCTLSAQAALPFARLPFQISMPWRAHGYQLSRTADLPPAHSGRCCRRLRPSQCLTVGTCWWVARKEGGILRLSMLSLAVCLHWLRGKAAHSWLSPRGVRVMALPAG